MGLFHLKEECALLCVVFLEGIKLRSGTRSKARHMEMVGDF